MFNPDRTKCKLDNTIYIYIYNKTFSSSLRKIPTEEPPLSPRKL